MILRTISSAHQDTEICKLAEIGHNYDNKLKNYLTRALFDQQYPNSLKLGITFSSGLLPQLKYDIVY